MLKQTLVNKVQEYPADLVWEIDNEDYYSLIFWTAQIEKGTEWIDFALEEMTVEFLQKLINDLENEK